MDKYQAWHSYMSSYGLPAYDETDVPDDAPLPRITYESVTDNIGDAVYPSASLWYRSTSWAEPSQKALDIARDLSYGGKTLPYDGGLMFITQGSPFAQRLADDDDTIRRIMLNFAVEYLSAD